MNRLHTFHAARPPLSDDGVLLHVLSCLTRQPLQPVSVCCMYVGRVSSVCAAPPFLACRDCVFHLPSCMLPKLHHLAASQVQCSAAVCRSRPAPACSRPPSPLERAGMQAQGGCRGSLLEQLWWGPGHACQQAACFLCVCTLRSLAWGRGWAFACRHAGAGLSI